MAASENKANERRTVQTVSAVQQCKQRMAKAKAILKKLQVGETTVIEGVIALMPAIDSLAYKSRWHNAWQLRSADPELTIAVENVANAYQVEANANKKNNRLGRQGLDPN